jgi:hypothetical protein
VKAWCLLVSFLLFASFYSSFGFVLLGVAVPKGGPRSEPSSAFNLLRRTGFAFSLENITRPGTCAHSPSLETLRARGAFRALPSPQWQTHHRGLHRCRMRRRKHTGIAAVRSVVVLAMVQQEMGRRAQMIVHLRLYRWLTIMFIVFFDCHSTVKTSDEDSMYCKKESFSAFGVCHLPFADDDHGDGEEE